MNFYLDEIPFELSRKSVKNINLRINSRGEVRVSAPFQCPEKDIWLFLKTRKDWIRKHRKRFLTKPLYRSGGEYKSGETHYFLGQPYTLSIVPTSLRSHIELNASTLTGFVKTNDSVAERKALFDAWYRKQMRLFVPELLEKWEAVLSVRVSSWHIRSMKTRWGSCNTQVGRIWLNLDLIKKPIQCLEYVLVHEMVHLLEPSHNKRFYALMSLYLPDWKEHEKTLKRYQMKINQDSPASQC